MNHLSLLLWPQRTQKAAPIIRELMTALTKDIDGQPGTNVVGVDQMLATSIDIFMNAIGKHECVRKAPH